MTPESVREFAESASNWCHAQADLVGYWFDPLEDGARVRLLWRDGRFAAREFTASEVSTMGRDDVVAALLRMADEFLDSGQPPRNARNLGYANYPIEPS